MPNFIKGAWFKMILDGVSVSLLTGVRICVEGMFDRLTLFRNAMRESDNDQLWFLAEHADQWFNTLVVTVLSTEESFSKLKDTIEEYLEVVEEQEENELVSTAKTELICILQVALNTLVYIQGVEAQYAAAEVQQQRRKELLASAT